MAIAFDASSNSTPGTGNMSWTHTPVGTPRGIAVAIAYPGSATDEISSVTYGGVALTLATNGYFAGTTGLEDGSVAWWWLGTGIPTGAQTVVVTVSGGSTKAAVCISATANYDVIENAFGCTTFESNSASNIVCASQNVHIQRGECLVLGVLLSGEDAIGSVAPDSGYTQIVEYDFGTMCGAWNRRTTNYPAGGGSTGNLAAWTQSSDDAHAICLLLMEDAFFPIVGQISETDSAQAITGHKTKAIGQSSETDTAQAITAKKALAIGLVTETDTAQAMSPAHSVTLGQCTESDTSQAIAAHKTKTLGLCEETDECLPLDFGPTIVVLGQAVEADTAIGIDLWKSLGARFRHRTSTRTKKLRVNMRATTGTVHGRIVDSSGSELSGSRLSTSSATLNSQESGALTMIDDETYTFQAGHAGADAGEIAEAAIIVS